MSFRSLLRLLTALMLLLPLTGLQAGEQPLTTVRVGVLEFGTVNWELDVIQAHELAKKRGIDLKIVSASLGRCVHHRVAGRRGRHHRIGLDLGYPPARRIQTVHLRALFECGRFADGQVG